jgi:two-component system NtrC family sensor kinase
MQSAICSAIRVRKPVGLQLALLDGGTACRWRPAGPDAAIHACSFISKPMAKDDRMIRNGRLQSSYYKSLTRNMVVLVMLISLTPMLLTTGLILDQFRISYHEKAFEHLKEVVSKHKQIIDTFLKEKLADIRLVAFAFSFDQLKEESLLSLQLMRLQRQFGPVFVDLGLVDGTGQQVSYAGPFKLGRADYSDSDWFRNAIQSQFYISDVFLGLRGLPHFIMAVRSESQGKKWILRATIDFVAFNRLVSNIRIGETGFAYILNKAGEFQTQPIFNFTPAKGCYGQLFDCSQKQVEPVSISERPDDSGRRSIYVTALLKNDDWLLVYRQQSDDAFATLHRAQRIAVAIFLVTGLISVTMSIILALRMVNRIATADREKELMNQQVIETGKLAAIGELAAGIAHEINNPVAIMVEEAGWIEDLLAEEEFEKSENLKEFKRALTQIHDQGQRCKEITHKLLSFARKTDSRIQQIDPNAMIEDVVGLSNQRAKYSNVQIRTELAAHLPAIQVSPSEMQQVFLNLINNALDALEKTGGTVTVGSRHENEWVIIDVSDDGPGIPQVNLARIFDPFFTTKPVGKGTGLGLSICYGIMKKLGGEIEVKSTLNAGTTFRLRFPLAKVTPASPQIPSDAPVSASTVLKNRPKGDENEPCDHSIG